MATTGHRASSPSWPLGGDPGPWLLTLAPGAIAMPWGITSRHPGLAWEAGRLQRAQPIGSICAKTLAEQKGKQPSRGAYLCYQGVTLLECFLNMLSVQ